MKNIFKFLLVGLACCSVANAVTLPNLRAPHEELPALKPANFATSGVVIDCTKIDTTNGCGIKSTTPQSLLCDQLSVVVEFLDGASRKNLMHASKRMLTAFLLSISVGINSTNAVLSLAACFPGIRLNDRSADLALSVCFLPDFSVAKFIAAGAGINLSCVLPSERQFELVRRHCSKVYGGSFAYTGNAVVSNPNSVLGFEHVRELINKVTEGQQLTPKLERCVRGVLEEKEKLAQAPQVESDTSATSQDNVDWTEFNLYLGNAQCEECRYGNDSCRQITTAEELSTATFAEVEAAAVACGSQECFSQVRYLFATRLAQEGEDQNIERLHRIAENGQAEAQFAILDQTLNLPFFSHDEPIESCYSELCRRTSYDVYLSRIEYLINNGFRHVKKFHADELAYQTMDGCGKARRLLFAKALRECLTNDADMTYLANFCQPAVITRTDIQIDDRLSFKIEADTLLLFLVELRAAQRANVTAVAE